MARDMNAYKRDGLFAATPPSETLNMITPMVAASDNGEVIIVNDIGRVFYHAKVARDAYVQLPSEDVAAGEERMCGKHGFPCTGRGMPPRICFKSTPNNCQTSVLNKD